MIPAAKRTRQQTRISTAGDLFGVSGSVEVSFVGVLAASLESELGATVSGTEEAMVEEVAVVSVASVCTVTSVVSAGACVGVSVGASVGFCVGASVGASVGFCVGVFVGSSVGGCTGFSVGFSVGCSGAVTDPLVKSTFSKDGRSNEAV